MQAAHHRPLRTLEHLADLRVGEPFQLAQEYDRSVIGGQISNRLPHPPVALRARPRLEERVWILDRELGLEQLVALDQLPALDDMQLGGMRGSVIVNVGLRVEPDRIDYEAVAVLAYRQRGLVEQFLQELRREECLRA